MIKIATSGSSLDGKHLCKNDENHQSINCFLSKITHPAPKNQSHTFPTNQVRTPLAKRWGCALWKPHPAHYDIEGFYAASTTYWVEWPYVYHQMQPAFLFGARRADAFISPLHAQLAVDEHVPNVRNWRGGGQKLRFWKKCLGLISAISKGTTKGLGWWVVWRFNVSVVVKILFRMGSWECMWRCLNGVICLGYC